MSDQDAHHGVGQLIGGRYRLRRELGRGGMATVYEGWDERMQCRVAVKILDSRIATESVRSRFRREARIQARLRHRHIVTATDWIEGDVLAMVTDYIDGPDLAVYLDQVGTLALDAVIDLMVPLAEGVAYAHDKGVVHRDLKPSNILLQRVGPRLEPMIADFGVAKVLNDTDGKTQLGALVGTPSYMAPEQMRGAVAIDARADVFALGVMLYEMATGALPSVFDGPMRPPSAFASGVPQLFDELVISATATDRSKRFASASALANALAACRAPGTPLGRGTPMRRAPAPVTTIEDQAEVAASAWAAAGRDGAPPRPREQPAPRRRDARLVPATVFEDPSAVADIVRAASPSPSSAQGAPTGNGPLPSPVESGGKRGMLAVAVGIAVGIVVLGGLIVWSSPAEGEAVHGEPTLPPAAEAPAVDEESVEACMCSARSTASVDVTCTATRRRYTVEENEAFGTRRVRTASKTRSRDPEGARQAAREAAEAFACVIEADPDNARNMGNLGWAYSLLGDRVKALTMQAEVRQMTDNDNLLAASYYTTAGLRCAAGDYQGALEAIDESLSLKTRGRGVERRKRFRERLVASCER